MSTFAELGLAAQHELWAVLALRHARGISARRARTLAGHFGGVLPAVEAVLANPLAWVECGIVGEASARRFAAGDWREDARREWDALRSGSFTFLTWGDEDYPALLRETPDAPLLLYYKGDPSLANGPAVAVVGARACSREGIAVSAWFARHLARAGVTVISGMARGIDRAAHLAALPEPGSSVAVLGTGMDIAYPACNRDLYGLLGRKGLLLSEYAPGAGALAKHFPIRNRIISGLAHGVLVVEAAGRSGSLITARLALEQNRDVFAVPGHTMASLSEGCRELIRRGARAVFSADDILEDLAPLLTLEASRAMEKRLAKERRKSGGDDERREADGGPAAILAESAAEGLAWIADDGAEVRARAGTGLPPAGKKKNGTPARKVLSSNSFLAAVAPAAPASAAPAVAGPPPPMPEEAAKSAVREPGEKLGREPVKDEGKRAAQESAQESAQEPGQKSGQKSGQEPGKGPGAEMGKGRDKKTIRKPDKEPAKGSDREPDRETSEAEARVLASLGAAGKHIDELARDLGLDVSRLSGLLTMLEVRGLLRRAPGMYYSLPEA